MKLDVTTTEHSLRYPTCSEYSHSSMSEYSGYLFHKHYWLPDIQ